MTLKRDENGALVLGPQGLPIAVGDDGQEREVDVPGLFGRVGQLSKESAGYQSRVAELEEKLKPLADITDLDAWVQKAREAIRSLEEQETRQLIESGELDKVTRGLEEKYQARIQDLRQESDRKAAALLEKVAEKEEAVRALMVKGAFERSAFVRDRTVLTPEIAFNTFGPNFRVEQNGTGGQTLVAYSAAGDKIMSPQDPTLPATPEEAIEILVGRHADRDAILKAGLPGSGAAGGAGQGAASLNADQVDRLSQDQFVRLRREGRIA